MSKIENLSETFIAPSGPPSRQGIFLVPAVPMFADELFESNAVNTRSQPTRKQFSLSWD